MPTLEELLGASQPDILQRLMGGSGGGGGGRPNSAQGAADYDAMYGTQRPLVAQNDAQTGLSNRGSVNESQAMQLRKLLASRGFTPQQIEAEILKLVRR